jgi:hypothetical protein
VGYDVNLLFIKQKHVRVMFPIMDLILVASMLQYVTNKVALLLTLRKKFAFSVEFHVICGKKLVNVIFLEARSGVPSY